MSDALVDLALRTACTPAAGLDVQRHLREVCDDVAERLAQDGCRSLVDETSLARQSDCLRHDRRIVGFRLRPIYVGTTDGRRSDLRL